MEHKFMLAEIYKEGGPWDQFAGEDHRMQLDEAHKMDSAMREKMTAMAGEELPTIGDELFDKAYGVYNSFNDPEGFTKKDAMMVDRIMGVIRDKFMGWKPTEEQRKAFLPIWKNEMDRYYSLGEDSKMK